MKITAAERRELSARAHALEPVVIVGAGGLSEAVLKEIDRSLTAHELIKVRIAGESRDDREAAMAAICDRLNAAPVKQIGKVVVVYRPKAADAPNKP